MLRLWSGAAQIAASMPTARSGEITLRYDPSTLEGLVVTAEDAAGVVVSDGPAVAAWFAG
ncbi:MAG: hypothetical protein WD156_10840 [Acidimicrobiia bacterium]